MTLPPKIALQPPKSSDTGVREKFCKGFPPILDEFGSKNQLPATKPDWFQQTEKGITSASQAQQMFSSLYGTILPIVAQLWSQVLE